jgi:hypothetical protein
VGQRTKDRLRVVGWLPAESRREGWSPQAETQLVGWSLQAAAPWEGTSPQAETQLVELATRLAESVLARVEATVGPHKEAGVLGSHRSGVRGDDR